MTMAMTITIGNETWQYFSSTGKAGDFLGEGKRGPAGLGNGVAQGKLGVVGSLSFFPFLFGLVQSRFRDSLRHQRREGTTYYRSYHLDSSAGFRAAEPKDKNVRLNILLLYASTAFTRLRNIAWYRNTGCGHSNPFGMRITCKLWLDLNVWHLLFSGYPSIAHRTFKCRPGFMRLPHQRHPVCRARCLRYVRCDRP